MKDHGPHFLYSWFSEHPDFPPTPHPPADLGEHLFRPWSGRSSAHEDHTVWWQRWDFWKAANLGLANLVLPRVTLIELLSHYILGFYPILLRKKSNKNCLCWKSSAPLISQCLSFKNELISGVPGWFSRLSVWLRLKSWSRCLWVRAPCPALCWQPRAWSLLWILCPPLSQK